MVLAFPRPGTCIHFIQATDSIVARIHPARTFLPGLCGNLHLHREIDLEKLVKLAIAPLAGFVFGVHFTRGHSSRIRISLLLIAFSQFAYGMANVLLNVYLLRSGADDYTFSIFKFIEFWHGDRINATHLSILFTPMLSLLFYSIFLLSRRKIILSILLLVSIGLSLPGLIFWSRRTPIYIIILVLALNLMIVAIALARRKHLLSRHRKSIFIGIGALAALGLFIIILGQQDRFASQLSSRIFNLKFLNDIRFPTYWSALQQIGSYPLGGYHMEFMRLQSAHNMWLDIANATGIVPFLLMLLILARTIYLLIKINLQKRSNRETTILLTSILSAILLNFMVEPILEGFHHPYILFCIIWGMLEANQEILPFSL